MKTVEIPVPTGKTTTIILLIVKCLILLVALTFALASLGVFAEKNNDIKKFTENSPFSDRYCILFLNDDQGFSSNSICKFVIGGQATVSFLILAALVTIVLAVIIKRRYCTTHIYNHKLIMCYYFCNSVLLFLILWSSLLSSWLS